MPIDSHAANRLAQCSIEPCLGGISIAGLATLLQPANPAMEIVEYECSQGCGTKLTGPRFFAPVTACDECRAKADKAAKLDRAKSYWEALCPPAFRETDKTHAGFPKAQYEATKSYAGTESLFMYGPSGTGKTRLAMWLLKRCLVQFNQHVGVLWPEQFKAVKNTRETLQWVQSWGRYDLLLIDDGLLTAASHASCTEAFKDLLDYRMRYKRHNIVTSQIGGDDVREQMAKFSKDTKADKELVAALVRRLKETCRVIPFAPVTPNVGEETFEAMPREARTVHVSPIAGEAMRYHVESWSDPKYPHLVDLLANAGAGECSCKSWQTRKWPAIRDGGSPGTTDTMCRHVIVARSYFLNRLLKQMAAQHEPQPSTHATP